MMLRYFIVLILIINDKIISNQCLNLNNVCSTLKDYQTIYRNKNCSFNPDVGSSPRLIAKRYGYTLENHFVTTEDGYILNLQHISGRFNEKSTIEYKKTILIFHGLAGSSAFWLLQGNRSLAFHLSHNGYDVWLGNWRGNYYSNKHVSLSMFDQKYWNFGFHEMAIYDLPACIDFIVNRTDIKRGNLIYIGHSMGTTISYIYSILKKEHAEENLQAIVSFAPVAYMKYVTGAFKIFAPITPLIASLLRAKGFNGVAQFFKFQRNLLAVTCAKYPLIITCNSILEFGSGLSEKDQFNAELLPVFFSFYPAAISLKTLEHYSQNIDSNGRFPWFDYGEKKNRKIYNQTIPPEYNVNEISIPVHLFVGSEDVVGDLKDVEMLEMKLNANRSSPISHRYLFPFAHNDFFLAKDMNKFYEVLLKVLQS